MCLFTSLLLFLWFFVFRLFTFQYNVSHCGSLSSYSLEFVEFLDCLYSCLLSNLESFWLLCLHLASLFLLPPSRTPTVCVFICLMMSQRFLRPSSLFFRVEWECNSVCPPLCLYFSPLWRVGSGAENSRNMVWSVWWPAPIQEPTKELVY